MKNLLLTITFLFAFTMLFAHDGHKKKQDSTQQIVDSLQSQEHQETVHTDHNRATVEEGHHAEHEKKVTADLDDFPTLHPLIVHFAIVLLIVGAALQLVNVYFTKKELAWTAFALVLIGFIAVYLAGRNFHPHTYGLTEHAKLVLEQHDFWADWTIYLGFIGVLLQGVNLFIFKSKRWAKAIVAVILLSAGYAVSRAGHYGSQLVHIEGVGPQGKYLELDHKH